MSAQDCEPPDCHVDPNSLEKTIRVWALTNTQSLGSAPALTLSNAKLKLKPGMTAAAAKPAWSPGSPPTVAAC